MNTSPHETFLFSRDGKTASFCEFGTFASQIIPRSLHIKQQFFWSFSQETVTDLFIAHYLLGYPRDINICVIKT